NFRITDNILTAPSDYTQFSVTAPKDARLPDGAGNVVGGFFDVNPNAALRGVVNLNELNTEIGANQIQHWNGVDVTTRARLRGGALLTGGVSTGRQSNDNCDVLAQIPEAQVAQ